MPDAAIVPQCIECTFVIVRRRIVDHPTVPEINRLDSRSEAVEVDIWQREGGTMGARHTSQFCMGDSEPHATLILKRPRDTENIEVLSQACRSSFPQSLVFPSR
jgi:hypothetical protein